MVSADAIGKRPIPRELEITLRGALTILLLRMQTWDMAFHCFTSIGWA